MDDETMTTAVLIHPMTPEGAVDLIHTLIRQRDQARRLAAHLEAECANCWGPIHKDALEQAQALQRIEEATDVAG